MSTHRPIRNGGMCAALQINFSRWNWNSHSAISAAARKCIDHTTQTCIEVGDAAAADIKALAAQVAAFTDERAGVPGKQKPAKADAPFELVAPSKLH